MPTPQTNHPLPTGFQLDRYRIERQLSLGGFSIVYLAYDEDGTPVAIKEYLPNVLNFFRANETVYMVMQYERGRTLQEHIHKHRGEIRETFVRNVFARLLNGLREVHAQKLLHLDIKPSNIYLRTDGNPVLLDFGAARQALRTDGPMLKPMYTPGFAAPEQYKEPEKMGPWTDIYAVGASMYACLAGAAPQAADKRVEKDLLQPAAKRWGDKYSKQLLQVIDWCMVLDSAERPASVFVLQKALAEHHHVVHEPTWLENLNQSLKFLFRK